MSILIKALKQAEREHLARATAAAPAFAATTVLEPEPAPPAVAPPPPRSSEALSLAPVESRAADTDGDPAQSAASRYERQPDPQHEPQHNPQHNPFAAAPAGATDPTLQAPYDTPPRTAVAPGPSRSLADVLQGAEPGLPPAPESAADATPPSPAAAPPLRPPASAEPRARNTAAAPATPAAATPADDLQAEQRKAARQLMAPAPASGRLRRIALVLGISVLAAGALAGAYWQGLFSGLDGVFPSTPTAAPAPTRTLAERMQSMPGATGDKGSKPHTRPAAVAAGAAAATTNAHEGASGMAALAGGGNSAAQFQASAALAANAARASDAIHLRPPEATPERIRALLQDAYTAAGRGDGVAAARIYQQVIELDHNNGDAWIGLAALASNSGDSAAANRDYRKALEIDPGDSVALGGLLGMQTGVDPQEAESRLRLLIVHDGAQPALQAALGKMLARQGRWLEAQETFYQAWIADPSQPDVAFNLAVTLERIRQPLPALSFYRRALELAQNHGARFNPAVAQERVTALTPKQP